MQGTVSRVLGPKGYAFIVGDAGVTYFAHVKSFRRDAEFHALRPGDHVVFRATRTADGNRAVDVYLEEDQP